MARVKIDLPEVFAFKTTIPVLMEHVNRADHVGNHSLVAMMNEAATRYVHQLGLKMHETGRTWSMVNADLEMSFRSEGRYGENIEISASITNVHRCGFDIVFNIESSKDGRTVAFGKIAYICMEASTGKAMTLPTEVKNLLTLH